jgi:hypothetical protein
MLIEILSKFYISVNYIFNCLLPNLWYIRFVLYNSFTIFFHVEGTTNLFKLSVLFQRLFFLISI